MRNYTFAPGLILTLLLFCKNTNANSPDWNWVKLDSVSITDNISSDGMRISASTVVNQNTLLSFSYSETINDNFFRISLSTIPF